MPISFMSSRRGSGSKKASRLGIATIFGSPRPALLRRPLAALRDVVAGAAGHRHLPERRVGDVVGDLVADGELGAAVDLDVLDDALVLAWEELGERVTVLVEVVVGVERLVRQLAVGDLDVLAGSHAQPPWSLLAQTLAIGVEVRAVNRGRRHRCGARCR